MCPCLFHYFPPYSLQDLQQISSVTTYCPSPDSLGDDGAVERDVEAELLWDGVQVAHGSEVYQTVGGLLAELNADAP